MAKKKHPKGNSLVRQALVFVAFAVAALLGVVSGVLAGFKGSSQHVLAGVRVAVR